MPDLVCSQHLHQPLMPACAYLILHDRMARRRFCGLHGLSGLGNAHRRGPQLLQPASPEQPWQ